MQKHIISIGILSFGLVISAFAMDDSQTKTAETKLLKEARKRLMNCCADDNYPEVKECLASHKIPIAASEYDCSLKSYVKTARMAVLLEKKVELDNSDHKGSILHTACENDCTPMLLQHAIKRYCAKGKKLDINEQRTIDGKTPLHVWAEKGYWYDLSWAREKLQILLDAGADCTLRDENGATALDILKKGHTTQQHAYQENKFECVKVGLDSYKILIQDLQQAMASKK